MATHPRTRQGQQIRNPIRVRTIHDLPRSVAKRGNVRGVAGKAVCVVGRHGRAGKAKYGNVKCNGYASKREHKRAQELRLLQKAGLISGLNEQVKYIVIPDQRDDHGKLLERACHYVCDFVYADSNGRAVYEDTKGKRTPDYIIKRKLMLWVNGIKIQEV